MAELHDNLPGYVFNEDGNLAVRQNDSFCSPEPIIYETFKGNWYYIDDSTVQISTQYWATAEGAGNLNYTLEIVELKPAELLVRVN